MIPLRTLAGCSALLLASVCLAQDVSVDVGHDAFTVAASEQRLSVNLQDATLTLASPRGQWTCTPLIQPEEWSRQFEKGSVHLLPEDGAARVDTR